MRGFPKTRAVQYALRVVTDPEFAQAGGPGLRKLAWLTLMETRARAARQKCPHQSISPPGGRGCGMIPSPEVIRQQQAEQRRRLVILAVAFALSLAAGWLIDHAFTAANAARIAEGF